MGKAKTNDRRVLRTVGLIRQAFQELAEEKGLDKVTVTDIAERADINRKTFYHHYESIDALIDEMLEEEAERLSRVLVEAARGEDGTVDVQAFFLVLSQKVTESLSKGNAALVNRDPQRLLSRIQPLLIRHISESNALHFDGVSGLYMEYMAGYFLSGLLSAYQQWAKDGKRVPLEGLASALSAATIGGVAGLYAYEKQGDAQEGEVCPIGIKLES